MAEKHIFIGLGGAGVNTVAQVKYKIYEKLIPTRHRSRLDQLKENYRFLFIDTDNKDVNDNNALYKDRFEHGTVNFINAANELVDLGDQNPRMIYDEARNNQNIRINKRIYEACDSKIAADLPNQDLRVGASAYRIKSRIAFARKADDFLTKLRMHINDLNRLEDGVTERNSIYFWVISSSNGGTGSGILNDVLYFVNMTYKQLVNKSDPLVGLILYMPQYYIDYNDNNERYPKNAYSVLSELTAFKVLSRSAKPYTPYHRLALLRDYHQFDTSVVYNPFMYCIPVDYQTDKGANMGSLSNMYYNTAEMLYYIHSGPGAKSFRSMLDNYINEIQTRSPEAFLIPMGYIALRKPEKDFEDYMHIRLRYELLKYGLVGSENKDDTTSVKDVYNNIINKYIFSSDKASLCSYLSNMADTMIEEQMPNNLIMDSDNKILNKLPASVNQTEAEQLIKEIEYAIYKKSEEIKEKLDLVSQSILQWIESNSLKFGLEHTQAILSQLDNYCTEVYNSYTIDSHGNMAVQRMKQQQIESIAQSLDNLYQKALEITFKEKIARNNYYDVSNYFQALKEYVSQCKDRMINDQLYEVLGALCIGENGIIDRMRRRIANLSAAATSILVGDSGAQSAYDDLAKAFEAKARDVTSVYLPNIQDFADNFGWIKDHKFSYWYEQIVSRSDVYDRGKGYIPRRNSDSNSLESFLKSLPNSNKNAMETAGYYQGETMKLFINMKVEEPKKTIQDILDYAVNTMNDKIKKNMVINDEWTAKTLPQFFESLDRDTHEDIRKRMHPSIFFSYSQEKDNNLITTRNIYVANTEKIAAEVMEYNPNNKNAIFNAGDDPSMIYTICAKLGLSFDFYRNYNVIKREYMSTPNKMEYHFHPAFAKCNGNFENIKLPEEFDPELVTLAQYILMNGFKDILAKYYYISEDVFDKDHYTNTPFIIEDKRILVAKRQNIDTQGSYIYLRKSDGVNSLFSSLVFGGSGSPYLNIYEKFKDIYISDMLAQAIESLIEALPVDAKNEVEMHYDDVRGDIINQYTILWKEAEQSGRRDENAFLLKLLSVFKTELNTYAKFIN